MHRPLESVSALRAREAQASSSSVVPAFLRSPVTRRKFLKVLGGAAVSAGGVGAGFGWGHAKKQSELRAERREKSEALRPTIDRILRACEENGIEASHEADGTHLLLCVQMPDEERHRGSEESQTSSLSSTEKRLYDLRWFGESLRRDAGVDIRTFFSALEKNGGTRTVGDGRILENVFWEVGTLQRYGDIPFSECADEKEEDFEEIYNALWHIDHASTLRDATGESIPGHTIVTRAGDGIERATHLETFPSYAALSNHRRDLADPTFSVMRLTLPSHELVLAYEEQRQQRQQRHAREMHELFRGMLRKLVAGR